jgi:hypothetical protein
MAGLIQLDLLTDFFNKIGHSRRFRDAPAKSASPLPTQPVDATPA